MNKGFQSQNKNQKKTNVYRISKFLNWGEKSQFYEGLRVQYIQQGFGGVKDLKLLGREKNFSDLFLKYNIVFDCAHVPQDELVHVTPSLLDDLKPLLLSSLRL